MCKFVFKLSESLAVKNQPSGHRQLPVLTLLMCLALGLIPEPPEGRAPNFRWQVHITKGTHSANLLLLSSHVHCRALRGTVRIVIPPSAYFYFLLCACMVVVCISVHMHVEVKGQLLGIGSFTFTWAPGYLSQVSRLLQYASLL